MRVLAQGERVPLLLDEQGLPLFYPTLVATTQLRNAGAAVNTIRNALTHIQVLLRWEAQERRNLVDEFTSGKFLSLPDIVSLRDFAKLDMRHVGARENTEVRSGNAVVFSDARVGPAVMRMAWLSRMKRRGTVSRKRSIPASRVGSVLVCTRTLPRVYNDRPGPLTKRSRDAYRHVPGKKWAGRRLSVTDVRRREADVGSFNPWRKSHGRLFGRALSDGLSLAISAVSRTSDGHKSGLIALNAPGTFRRLQGFSSCKQIVSAPAVRDWSGQAMFHRIFVHLHTSGSPFAKYGSWLAPAQPHQDQFCESSIGVLIV